ncbi:hypothetical protein ASE93_13885 [Serratia sp. Leaf50]|nr:hypothetical protein ASE93_13885 [Serratia sp. Leaf50]
MSFSSQSFLNNVNRVETSAATPVSYSVRSGEQSALEGLSETQKTVIDNALRQSGKPESTAAQKELLDEIINDTDCSTDRDKASIAWLDYEGRLKRAGVDRKHFAKFCNVNFDSLSKSITRELQSRVELNSAQKQYVENIIAKNNCTGSLEKTLQVWLDNKAEFERQNITAGSFAVRSNVSLHSFFNYLYQKKQINEVLSPEQEALIQCVIDEYGTSKDVDNVAWIMTNFKDEFIASGISRPMFAHKYGVVWRVINTNLSRLNNKNPLGEDSHYAESDRCLSSAPELATFKKKILHNFLQQRKARIEKIIQDEGCVENAVKAAAVWLKYKDAFIRQKIKQEVFSNYCQVSLKNLSYQVAKIYIKNKNVSLNEKQQILIETIFLETGCQDSITLAARVWNDRGIELETAGIKKSIYSSLCGFHPRYLSKNILIETKIAVELSQDNKTFLEGLILSAGCKKDITQSARVWVDNATDLAGRGINQMIFVSACELKVQSFTQAVIQNYRIKSSLNETQQALLQRIIDSRKIAKAKKKETALALAVTAWIECEQQLTDEYIHQTVFASACKVKPASLRRSVLHEKKLHAKLTDTQRNKIDSIILAEECLNNVSKASCAWLNNQTALNNFRITLESFANKCNVPPKSLEWLVRCERQARIELSAEQKDVIDTIIKNTHCRVNSELATTAWLTHRVKFEEEKIHKLTFARRCEVDITKFISAVSYKIKKSRLQPVEKQMFSPAITIKTEPTIAEQTIDEITLDDAGQVANVANSDTLRLTHRPLLDNRLPIVHSLTDPYKSLTLQTLGLISLEQINTIKVTGWGGMHAVFNTLNVEQAKRLKNTLLSEVQRQIANETMQAERMDKLMVSRGSHRQAPDSDEIINLGMGVLNPGPDPVAAYTVLGMYAGEFVNAENLKQIVRKRGTANSYSHSWATRTDKVIVDAYQSGNVLSNINTGCLPNTPELAENNVASVQIANRLNAYITIRDVAPGEEYFVSYGAVYDPTFDVDVAKKKERLLKLYKENLEILTLMEVTRIHLSQYYGVDIMSDAERAQNINKNSIRWKISRKEVKNWLDAHPLLDVIIKQEPVEDNIGTTEPVFIYVPPVAKRSRLVAPPSFRLTEPDAALLTPSLSDSLLTTPIQLASIYETLLSAAGLAKQFPDAAVKHVEMNANIGARLASISDYNAAVDAALSYYIELMQLLFDLGAISSEDVYRNMLTETGGDISLGTRSLTLINREQHQTTHKFFTLLLAAGERAKSHQPFRDFLQSKKTDAAHSMIIMQSERDGFNRLKHAAIEDWFKHPRALSHQAVKVVQQLQGSNLLPKNSELKKLLKSQTYDLKCKNTDEAIKPKATTETGLLHAKLIAAMPQFTLAVETEFNRIEQLNISRATYSGIARRAKSVAETEPSHKFFDLFDNIAAVNADFHWVNQASRRTSEIKDRLFEQSEIVRRQAMNAPRNVQPQSINVIQALFTCILSRVAESEEQMRLEPVRPYSAEGAIPVKPVQYKNITNQHITSDDDREMAELTQQLRPLIVVDRELEMLNQDANKTAVLENRLAELKGQHSEANSSKISTQFQKMLDTVLLTPNYNSNSAEQELMRLNYKSRVIELEINDIKTQEIQNNLYKLQTFNRQQQAMAKRAQVVERRILSDLKQPSVTQALVLKDLSADPDRFD